MSFGDGNLHDKYADVFKAMGMDVPDGFTRERHDRLIEGITRCKSMNAANVAEINRQERVIERQAERIAELERSTEHYRLKIICYENDVDARDALIRDMFGMLVCACEWDVLDGIAKRMRELEIEVD